MNKHVISKKELSKHSRTKDNTSYGGPEDLKLAIPVPEKRKGHAIQLMKSTVKSSR